MEDFEWDYDGNDEKFEEELDAEIVPFNKLSCYAESLYNEAGDKMEEETDQISLSNHGHLLSDKVASIIEDVLAENPLPYQLQDFQKLSLHALGSLRNVILVSPTGSGKMIINYLAIPGLNVYFICIPLTTFTLQSFREYWKFLQELV